MLSDTHPEAERVQLDLIRKMTVAERSARAAEWTRMVVNLSRQGLARANPDLDKREQFLSLGIDEGGLAKGSKLLLDIDGGSLSTEVERGRGHCHVIEEIYSKYLNKWFDRVFKGDELASMTFVFGKLGSADSDLFEDLAKVAGKLEAEAAVVLGFVVKGDEANARTRVLSSLPALRPLRKTISKTMQTLYSMQSDFVDIAGAV